MKYPENSGSPTSQKTPTAQPFLQDSSLMIALPLSQQHQDDIKLRDQPSGLSPKKESVTLSNSDTEVTLNFSIRFTDLTFGDLLGQGAYGKVFAGEWEFNTVAIKQYAAQDFSEQTKNEILKEAKVMATASTQSDYLVRLRGIVLEKPHYSLVMEYMPGGDLFHLLKSSQAFTWTMRYRISLDMTIGLHHLHQRGILHRDLKSLNVLLNMNFRAKLADFGLSTLKISSASTTTGEFKGTPLWSAPELFKRGAKATAAADLYALAMVFWELITRKIPFADAPNPSIAIDWVKSGEQENIPESTPEEFKTIILDCWNKTPEQRPTAAAVAKRLDTLWQGEHKKTLGSSSSTSSSVSGSTSSSTSSSSAPMSALLESSLATFSDLPVLPPQQLAEVKHSHQSSGVSDLPQLPKSVSADSTKALEMKRLLEEKDEIKKNSLTPQDKLIIACERGDLAGVKLAIQEGAKSLSLDEKGKHPIGAAVWGMSTDILDYLLHLSTNAMIPSWDEIERHNRQYYQNEVWAISQFSPVNFGDWQKAIEKIDNNIFLQNIHLQPYNQQFQKDLNWKSFSDKLKQRSQTVDIPQQVKLLILQLDQQYRDLRLKITASIGGVQLPVTFTSTKAVHNEDVLEVDEKKTSVDS